MTDRDRRVRLGQHQVLLLLVVASIGASAWQGRNDPPAGAMQYRRRSCLAKAAARATERGRPDAAMGDR